MCERMTEIERERDRWRELAKFMYEAMTGTRTTAQPSWQEIVDTYEYEAGVRK